MKRLAIIGSGDLGHQIAYHALNDGHYTPIGFFDDFNSPGTLLNGLPVLGAFGDIAEIYNENAYDVLMIGIGYKHFELRAQMFEKFCTTVPFGSIIHSSSYVDASCKLGDGVFIFPGCTLDMNAVIANNVLINAGCIVAHDSKIGQHSFLSPGVKIAGFVDVGEKVSLGIGTTIIDNITINDNVRTGAGTVVIKDLAEPGLYVGIPAGFKKK